MGPEDWNPTERNLAEMLSLADWLIIFICQLPIRNLVLFARPADSLDRRGIFLSDQTPGKCIGYHRYIPRTIVLLYDVIDWLKCLARGSISLDLLREQVPV